MFRLAGKGTTILSTNGKVLKSHFSTSSNYMKMLQKTAKIGAVVAGTGLVGGWVIQAYKENKDQDQGLMRKLWKTSAGALMMERPRGGGANDPPGAKKNDQEGRRRGQPQQQPPPPPPPPPPALRRGLPRPNALQFLPAAPPPFNPWQKTTPSSQPHPFQRTTPSAQPQSPSLMQPPRAVRRGPPANRPPPPNLPPNANYEKLKAKNRSKLEFQDDGEFLFDVDNNGQPEEALKRIKEMLKDQELDLTKPIELILWHDDKYLANIIGTDANEISRRKKFYIDTPEGKKTVIFGGYQVFVLRLHVENGGIRISETRKVRPILQLDKHGNIEEVLSFFTIDHLDIEEIFKTQADFAEYWPEIMIMRDVADSFIIIYPESKDRFDDKNPPPPKDPQQPSSSSSSAGPAAPGPSSASQSGGNKGKGPKFHSILGTILSGWWMFAKEKVMEIFESSGAQCANDDAKNKKPTFAFKHLNPNGKLAEFFKMSPQQLDDAIDTVKQGPDRHCTSIILGKTEKDILDDCGNEEGFSRFEKKELITTNDNIRTKLHIWTDSSKYFGFSMCKRATGNAYVYFKHCKLHVIVEVKGNHLDLSPKEILQKKDARLIHLEAIWPYRMTEDSKGLWNKTDFNLVKERWRGQQPKPKDHMIYFNVFSCTVSYFLHGAKFP